MKRLFSAMLAVLTLAAVAEERTFTVGFDADFPPYGFKDGNEFKGFDLDLAREICRRKGWKFAAKPIDWAVKDMELNSGAIDCIWNGFTMQGREDAYTWSVPYIGNSQVVIVRADSKIRSLADLEGKVVGVQNDTPVQAALQGRDAKNGRAATLGRTFRELVVLPNYNEAIFELESMALDAVAMDIGVAQKKMQDNPGRFRLLEQPAEVMTETYGIGFKLGQEALRDEVEAELRKVFLDGEGVALAKRYGLDKAALTMEWVDTGKRAEAAGRQELSAAGLASELLRGLVVSVEIFLFTLLIAFPLGVPLALARMSRNRVLSGAVALWISIIRGTPLMLQIIFIYFAPYILFGMPLADYPRLLATVIAFGLNYAAYFAEIYRGGILAIDRGQHEAAMALGLSKGRTFIRVILPQAVKRVIPAIGNEVITLVKDTSLAFTIAVAEMFTIAKQLSSANTTMTPLIAAAVFYYIFNALVAKGMSLLERRLSYYD